jgi:outer membrane protein assembly factor BamB
MTPKTHSPGRRILAALSAATVLSPLTTPCNGSTASADWPQWRGPARNGVALNSPSLASQWQGEGPKRLWDSETIPADDDGGHGSAVVAQGKVYLSVVWHRDEPSQTRTLTELILRTKLGYQNPGPLGKELIDKIEATRESLSPSLRGGKLDEFIERFVAENLSRKQKEFFSGYVSGRFKKGKLAIPLPDYEKLKAQQDKPFASQADFEAWLGAQGFAEHVQKAVLDAVPASERKADDTLVCLDEKSGKTLWITRVPGEPKGRNCSSTPCVAGQRVFAMGSTHLFAVDAQTGKLEWARPLPGKAPGSSPLVVGNLVVILAGKLSAFDVTTGAPVWEQPKISGTNASPVLWEENNTRLILANGRGDFSGVDPKTGEIRWSVPGGGDSTPAISGDRVAVLSNKDDIGFCGYRIAEDRAERLWNQPTDARRSQSSPIIHEGHVYLLEDGDHRCIDLQTGQVRWTQKVPSTITSPVLADGKLFVIANNGNNALMIKASPEKYEELGKTNVKALWVASPAIANGCLFIRHRTGLRAYDLTASAP